MSFLVLVEDAAREIDRLDQYRRVLLTCVYKTAERDQLAATVARETSDALFGGLIRDKRGGEAVAEFLDFHLSIFADDVDEIYFNETEGA